jgi:hypothetical protein
MMGRGRRLRGLIWLAGSDLNDEEDVRESDSTHASTSTIRKSTAVARHRTMTIVLVPVTGPPIRPVMLAEARHG